MKKIFLMSGVLMLSLFLCGCWENENWLPKEELPEESPVCPEGFYRFDSIKSCVMMENAEVTD